MAVKPVIFAVNAPVEEAAPLSTLLSDVVGFVLVLQQMPYAVAFGVPNAVILPFPVAVVELMPLTAWVVTVGATAANSLLIVTL